MSLQKDDELHDKIDKILLLLHGNGKLGVCGKVQILWGTSLFIIITVVATLIKTFLK